MTPEKKTPEAPPAEPAAPIPPGPPPGAAATAPARPAVPALPLDPAVLNMVTTAYKGFTEFQTATTRSLEEIKKALTIINANIGRVYERSGGKE